MSGLRFKHIRRVPHSISCCDLIKHPPKVNTSFAASLARNIATCTVAQVGRPAFGPSAWGLLLSCSPKSRVDGFPVLAFHLVVEWVKLFRVPLFPLGYWTSKFTSFRL